MTGAAGDMIARGVASRKRIEEITLNLAMGSIGAMKDNYSRKARKKSDRSA
jgi:hypothetical protein